MSAVELLYGSCAAQDFAAPTVALDGSDQSVVQLADVEIGYALYEVPMAAVLPMLPVSLHPSVPAVLATNFWRVPESPFGPFQFAYVGIACRTGIKPRHLVYAAWCDNEAAAGFLAGRYGVDAVHAELYLRETYDRVRGAVAIDGETVLEVITTDTVTIVGGGAAVKYSPTLNLAAIDGAAALVQFEAAYEFKRVLRGPVQASVFNAHAFGQPTLVPSYPIAGTFAVCDVALLPARFSVDLALPAEAGGAKKLR